MRVKVQVAVALVALAAAATAAVVPVSPTGGAKVALLPDAQKRVMSFATHGERVADIKADGERPKDARIYAKGGAPKWRTSLPLRLEWRTTDGEAGPWKIVIGKTPDLAGATEVWLNSEAALRMSLSEKGGAGEKVDGKTHVYTYEMPCANLEIGRTYYWKVWSNVACRRFPHGSTMYAKCPHCDGRRAVASDVASFATEDLPLRWIKMKGGIANVRDLGGWKTPDGRRVRQGMAFRGQGLNDGSVNGERPGPCRITVEDLKYMRDVLGIKTDLDLRTDLEAGGMGESPLGEGVRLVQRASPAYEGLFAVGAKAGGFNMHLCADGKKATAENFRVFCDKANYPIYFHCAGGADRTGSLAYVLLGVLGVQKHDAEVDWESTFYPNLSELDCARDQWRSEQHFDDGLAAYGGADTPWTRRIELYLADCGVTQEEIDRFRAIMLEP
ncbi:MAG: tyrosine-protein phosphatase [Kiritimatiellae bacterium]|nr:tyrosine-protein phosphatase [Kiritimatiellia bacterium]